MTEPMTPAVRYFTIGTLLANGAVLGILFLRLLWASSHSPGDEAMLSVYGGLFGSSWGLASGMLMFPPRGNKL